jgi:hypothetical protein
MSALHDPLNIFSIRCVAILDTAGTPFFTQFYTFPWEDHHSGALPPAKQKEMLESMWASTVKSQTQSSSPSTLAAFPSSPYAPLPLSLTPPLLS